MNNNINGIVNTNGLDLMDGMAQEDIPEVDPLIEVGNTGLSRVSGWVEEEWLHDLRGQNGIKKYKEMRDNCSVVGAMLFAIKMLVRQSRFYVQAGGDTDADKEAADFLDQCLMNDMEQTFQELLSDILSMLPFGWAYHEMVFKKRMGETGDPKTNSQYNDGKIGFRKISIRAQETFWKWEFDDKNNLLGMWQLSPPTYQLNFIPYEKCLLFRYDTEKNNPEGRSILRNAYVSYYYKKKIIQIEGIGIERDLAGIPFATVPAKVMSKNASDEEKSTLRYVAKMVKQVRQDKREGIVFPAAKTADGQDTGFTFSLMTTGGKRNFDTNAIITRHEQRIAQTVAADFIFLGLTGVGSNALSTDKTDLFGLAIGTILDSIVQVFNKKAIPMLFKLNAFSGLTALPTLEHDPIEPPDLLKLSTFMTSLTQSGATLFPNDQLLNHLLELAGLPPIPEETLQAMAASRQQQTDMAQAQLETQKAQAQAILQNKVNTDDQNNDKTATNPASEPNPEDVNKMYGNVKKNDDDLLDKLREKGKQALNVALQDSLDDLLDQAKDIGVTEELIKFVEANNLLSDAVMQALSDSVGDYYGVGWNGGAGMIGTEAYKQGVEVNMGSLDASKHIADYMEDRGAKVLAGMEETTTNLVRNCISNSLANEEDWNQLSERLQTNYAFSENRAETVARTESAVGYNTGFAKVGNESKCVKSLLVTDLAECGCQECIDANGEKSCDWLIDNPIAHPNCTRDASYVYDFGSFRTVDDGED